MDLGVCRQADHKYARHVLNTNQAKAHALERIEAVFFLIHICDEAAPRPPKSWSR